MGKVGRLGGGNLKERHPKEKSSSEWQYGMKSGIISPLSVAFPRPQAPKRPKNCVPNHLIYGHPLYFCIPTLKFSACNGGYAKFRVRVRLYVLRGVIMALFPTATKYSPRANALTGRVDRSWTNLARGCFFIALGFVGGRACASPHYPER